MTKHYLAFALVLIGSTSYAQEPESKGAPERAEVSAEAGAFLPFTLGARVDSQRAFVSTTSGYDSANRTALLESAAALHIWGPFAIKAAAVYTADNNTLRPQFGLQVQALRQAKHGIDGSIAAFYKAEGLTEPEGEIEVIIALGRQFGRTSLFANLVVGSDFDGQERDGEIRVAGLQRLGNRFFIGLDNRVRFDLGSSKLKLLKEPSWDLIAGPTGVFTWNRLAIIAQAGASAVNFNATGTAVGAIALGGFGVSF